MPKCNQCGKDASLPFTCAYCGGNYCAEHRLPESHNCTYLPKVPPPYIPTYDSSAPLEKPAVKRKHFSLKKLAALVAMAVIVGAILWSAYPTLVELTQSPSVSPSPSTITPTPINTPPYASASPDTTPSELSHGVLVDYALTLINSDRQSTGLQNVTLSNIDSGQRHAENMLENKFFSHWDTDGYKPYMRYTIAGGKGAVAENIGWSYGASFAPKDKIKDLEHSMMYDDAEWDWGHRDNILDPLHNKVSIGIAYDTYTLYLVQDFEDDYISWSTLSLSNQVLMQGTILKTGESISQVAIFFDNPTPLTTQQFANSPYNGSYDAGTYVGMAVSPPPSGYQYSQPEEGILVIADTWSVTGQSFNINFGMSSVFAQYGRGVYTLYLWTDSDEYLTSLSVWN